MFSRLKKRTVTILAFVLVFGNVLASVGTPLVKAAEVIDHIVISQVYGGGGNSGAQYKNDFIELYNPTDEAINVQDWKVRYANSTGIFSVDNTNVTVINGTMAPKSYYLIQEAAGTGGALDLPTPDASGPIAMSGTNGKVKLEDETGNIIDLVGFGSANESETSPVPVLSNTTAAIRNPAAGALANSRGQDTNNNQLDFTVTAPDPRNSQYNELAVREVTASHGSNAWPAGTEISLSTETENAVVYVSVNGSGEDNDFVQYTGPIEITEPTIIKAYAEADGFADSQVSTFEYNLLEQSDISTARLASVGQNVTISGIVTHIDGSEMYIQDETAGIVLYGFTSFANIGDRVEVSGYMDIYSNLQEIRPLEGLPYQVVEENVTIPQPQLITGNDLSLANGEAYEAVLVTLENVTIENVVGSKVTASQDGTNFIIYSTIPTLQVGATFARITGVIKQYSSDYQFIPLGAEALIEDMFSVIASPGAGQIITGSSVTLSTPTSHSVIYFTTDGSTPTESSMMYAEPIQINADTTIKAIVVSADDTSDVYTFNYVATEKPRIHNIQGESHTTPFVGQTVDGVEGIVTQYGYTFATGAYKGFFMQDAEPDDNVNTSEGIFVYSTSDSLKPAIGDLVSVTGSVSEYNEGSSSNLTSTQITMTNRVILSSNNTLPEPVLLGEDGRIIPSSIIDNDAIPMTEFQPEEDAIDFYESLEGMLVELPNPTIISPYWTSGSGNSLVYNIPTRIQNDDKDVISPAGGLVLKEDDNLNPQRLLIAYGNPGKDVSTGDAFASNITGVIGYNNGNFKVIPAWNSLPEINESAFQRETTTIVPDEDQLLIASYNIENYYPGVGADKTGKLAQSIVSNMKIPDIISVVEMQDGNGETNNGVVEADVTTLVQAIVTAGGPEYSYVDIAPQNNMDGGAPGGNIRVGFLYNPERVTLSASVNNDKGSATQAVSYVETSDQLTYNPGRIEPTNSVFSSSRKPLAAQFEFNGEKVIVIANHFNSKSGDTGPFGVTQPAVKASETQRHQMATVVNNFVKDIKTKNADANIVVVGDLNDFQFTKTAQLLKGNELDNLIDALPLNERYTYTYDGNSQVLDHIMVSKNLTSQAEVDVVHLNADFSPTDGRVSDHDPVLAQINLGQSDSDSDFELTILHTNDTHANLDTTNSPNSVLRRVTAIKEEKAQAVNPILVDAGDVFSGTLYFNKYLGQADLEFMNLLGYDAMTFGNHEFDKNSEVLAAFIRNANFTFVSSNVNFTNDEILSQYFENEIGNPAQDKTIYPAIIKELDGEQVGIIGLTTEDTANIASPGDVTFDDAVEKAKEAVAMLEAQQINKIIVLSHLGYDADLELAKEVEGVDVIVGGHSHTKLDVPVVDNTDPTAPKLIVQTGEKGQFLGKLNVKFDENGVLTQWDGELVSIDEKDGANYVYAEDEEAKEILEKKYKPGIQSLMNEVVGYTDVVLNGVRANVRSQETNLGNLIADGMLYAAKAAGTNAVIALQNGGGIRDSINAGEITQGEVLTVLPFNNDLVTITLTGQEILAALENGVSTITTTKDGRFPHISGMRFDYDSTKPVNERIVRVQVKDGDKYVPLDLTASYEVATNAFTAQGGDFYASLEKAYKEGRVNLLYLPDYEVFTKYIEEVGNITAETSAVEGRIVDLQGSPLPTPTPTPSQKPTNPTPTVTPTPTEIPKPIETPTPTSPTNPAPDDKVEFKDIESHWAADSIQRAANAVIINGYQDGTFRPDNTATRAEFITMIGRTLGLSSTVDGEFDFADANQVPTWARSFFVQLIQDGVINGYGDNTLRPAHQITRTEMAVIMVRALGISVDENATSPFNDNDQISAWAIPYIAAAQKAGLIYGLSGNRFGPNLHATRAEVATLMLSAQKYMENQPK